MTITKNPLTMKSRMRIYPYLLAAGVALASSACKSLETVSRTANTSVPDSFSNSGDTVNSGQLKWKEYFTDPYLQALIDTALNNNQELNIMLQEISITQNEIRTRKGEYLPFVGLKGGAGLDKKARYTPLGASEATTDIEPGRAMPEPVPDFLIGAYASWEVDIWSKLHNAKKSAVLNYLATVEGRNFMVTNLIAEIANSYYELLALDNQLEIVKQNIEIQGSA